MNWRLILTETLRSIPGLIRSFREKRRDMVSLKAASQENDKKIDRLLDGLSDND